MKSLLYITPLYKKEYAVMAVMLLESIKKYSNSDKFDLLIIDDTTTHPIIQYWYNKNKADLKFDIIIHTRSGVKPHLLLLSGERFFLYSRWKEAGIKNDIKEYPLIFYIDTDCLVSGDIYETIIAPFFQRFPVPTKDIIYAKKEDGHKIYHCQLHPEPLFIKNKDDCYCAGNFILDNRKHDECVRCFEFMEKSLNTYSQKPIHLVCQDQPILHLYTHIHHNSNNEFISPYISTNSKVVEKEYIIHHFAGEVGHHQSKIPKMNTFAKQINVQI